ncbi:MAG: IclR family transcriptional regulator [Spirochaetia bacterium]|nr:IclR family transcriptional regulator [Spirochaetia bacterium]NLK05007.1 IclR family transcriptional regulator [Spirochaetales bacterium]
MGKKETETGSDKQQTSGVIRTIAILETLSRHQSINLESLAKETKLPKATLLRFLSTLVSLGYVYRDPSDLYSLTLKMFSVGSHGLEHIDLIHVANPIAQRLCDELGETVHMGVKEDNEAVYVLKKESSFTIRMYSRVGKTIPLYCTAIGKIMLSDLSEEELKKYLEAIHLKPFTPNTIQDPQKLNEELKQIRKQGWASDNEEHEMGTLCLGAPIRDYTGKVVAAMSVSWPLFRFNPEEQKRITCSITDACEGLSRLLGWTNV